MRGLSLQRAVLFMLVIFSVGTFASCQTMKGAYNRTKEMLGAQKRDILVSEIKDARIILGEVRMQFQSSMDVFRSVFESKEGNLEKMHWLLKSEYEKSGEEAVDIQKSLNSVTGAAEAFLVKWEAELNYYSNYNLRTSSEERLKEASDRNRQFIDSLTRVNEKSAPILTTFSELVLFSTHNLNSASIDSLNIELVSVKEKVDLLIAEIDSAMSEADALVILMEGVEVAP